MWQNVKCVRGTDENVCKYIFTNEGKDGTVAEVVHAPRIIPIVAV
jgi:hypothetical protein